MEAKKSCVCQYIRFGFSLQPTQQQHRWWKWRRRRWRQWRRRRPCEGIQKNELRRKRTTRQRQAALTQNTFDSMQCCDSLSGLNTDTTHFGVWTMEQTIEKWMARCKIVYASCTVLRFSCNIVGRLSIVETIRASRCCLSWDFSFFLSVFCPFSNLWSVDSCFPFPKWTKRTKIDGRTA